MTELLIKLAKKELKPKFKIIRLNVLPTNKPAISFYKKLGFKKVAVVPKQIQYKGNLVDEIIIMKKKQFEICVRGVIQKQNKILVCWHKEKKHYFFPGGHIEFGESAKKALIRELKEELDIVVKKLSFIGTVENIYIEKRDKYKEHLGKHHEINLVFSVSAEKVKDKSLEDHIDFFFLDTKQFAKRRVLPLTLKKQVLKWLKDRKNFWITNE